MQDGGFASGGAIALIVVLGVLLVAAVVVLVVGVRRLQRAQRRIDVLEAEIEAAGGDTGEIPALPRSLGRAERAMRTMVDAAFKVRDQGVGGLLMESMDNLSRWAIEDRSEITKMAANDGTVTVFFSDIEGSTALNAELGDEGWVRLLIAHDTLVRAEVERRNGHIVKSQGDGFMVVFTSPVDAVKAGLSIQRALAGLRKGGFKRTPLKVRIGIHEGTAIARDGDLFGQTVAMAARVGAKADGDEILVTEPVAAALAGNARFELTERDAVELKGLPDKHALWLVESAPPVEASADGVAGVAEDPGQHPHRAERRGFVEAARQRPLIDPVRRLAAVRGVGEHVVDHERAAARDPAAPALVVVAGVLVGVAAVDEHQGEGRAPVGRRPSWSGRPPRPPRPRDRPA